MNELSIILASAGETVYGGSMLLALPLAVLAGVVSFASPCVLPLVPGYLGYVGGMAAATATGGPGTGSKRAGPTAGDADASSTVPEVDGVVRRRGAKSRLLAGVGLFIAGFALVFVTYGVLFGTLGSLLAEHEILISRILGGVVVLMGLAFLGMVSPLQTNRQFNMAPSAGLWGAPVLGFVFGLGWTPCVGPALIAINALALDQGTAARGGLLAVAYSVGLGVPFLLIALGLESSTRMLGFMRRYRVAIMRIGGGLLIAIGLALVTGLWNTWTQSLAGLISGFETAL